jgi:predicted DNA-binding transcriptional regulator YafY
MRICMINSLQSRALIFFELLRAQQYPNATSLSKKLRCSRSTANRCIERLEHELKWPIRYDATERGYVLTDIQFVPEVFSPGKDEFTALLLLRELSTLLEAKDLQESIDLLWRQCSAKSANLSRELEPLLEYFSSNLTQVAQLSDTKLFELIEAAQRGEPVEVIYRSPWRHDADKSYRGRVMKVHFSDGTLYVFLHEASGRGLVLNGSFIKSFKVLQDAIPLTPLPTDSPLGDSAWLEGFGVWASEKVQSVQIQILPPASHYYAKQRWHEDQVDTFDDQGVLTRTFPAMVSPEVARRILSIGKYIQSVSPKELCDDIMSQLDAMKTTLAS